VRPARPGTARAALANRDFRTVWLGNLGSSMGSWMQTLVIGLFFEELTGQALWVGLAMFAQMVPMLLFTIPGGVVADRFDRRRLLISLQCAQLVFSGTLGVLTLSSSAPPKLAVIALVFLGGCCNSMNAPAYSAVLPALVGSRDLPGAIALNSAAINGSRIVGPALGGALYPLVGPGWLYLANAATFLFVVAALASVRLPEVPRGTTRGRGQLAVGLRYARADAVLRRILSTMTLFSLFSLPFISLWANLVRRHLGFRTETPVGLLYAVFGAGALTGSLAVGSVLAGRDRARLIRLGLTGFGAVMAVIAVGPPLGVQIPLWFLLGACYFGTTTSMLTIFQGRLDDRVRGRVMSLWFMSFGGTVSLGGPVFGPILDATSTTVVLGISAAVALVLGWWCDLAPREGSSQRPVG
jgi:MFS family permease